MNIFEVFKAIDEDDKVTVRNAFMDLAHQNADLRIALDYARQGFERMAEIEIGTEVARISKLALGWINDALEDQDG